MTPELIGLIAFVALIVLLFLFMLPASRKLDGSQKYRQNRIPGRDLDPDTNKRGSMSAIQIALAALLGHGAASASDKAESDASNTGDGGGGDGGGD
jgi:hypothetical protein